MVVAVLQAALALFPLGLRFVFYPFLNLKGNHALEDMDPSSASSWGGWGGECFSQVLKCFLWGERYWGGVDVPYSLISVQLEKHVGITFPSVS